MNEMNAKYICKGEIQSCLEGFFFARLLKNRGGWTDGSGRFWLNCTDKDWIRSVLTKNVQTSNSLAKVLEG